MWPWMWLHHVYQKEVPGRATRCALDPDFVRGELSGKSLMEATLSEENRDGTPCGKVHKETTSLSLMSLVLQEGKGGDLHSSECCPFSPPNAGKRSL